MQIEYYLSIDNCVRISMQLLPFTTIASIMCLIITDILLINANT